MLTQLQVREYADRLASDEPTPGGGSGAALVGALGAALGEMVANFTVGKPKYREAWDEVQPLLKGLTAHRQALLDLTDQDAEAYAKVGAAYGMPRETEQQKAARAAAIQEALKAAAKVPQEVCEHAAAAIGLLPGLLAHGNPNLVSDVGVAADLCRAAFRCGWLNVEINLAGLKDEAHKAAVRSDLQEKQAAVEKQSQEVWTATVRRVQGG